MHHAFPHCNIDDALILYKLYVRPILEFNTVSWNHARYVREVNCVEKIQRRFTKRIWSDDSVSYSARLPVCKLLALESRRRIVDLIYLHKVLHEDAALADIKGQLRPLLGVTRGHGQPYSSPEISYCAGVQQLSI